MRFFSLFLTVISLSGCATFFGGNQQNTSVQLRAAAAAVSVVDVCKTTSFAEASERNLSNACLDKGYYNLIGKCAAVLGFLEERADKRRTKVLTLAAAGAVAGSIVAPAITAANGSMTAIAAFSGFSGYTNAAQQLMSGEGYSRDEIVQIRGRMIESLNETVEQWAILQTGKDGGGGQTKLNAKMALLDKMVATCSMYSLQHIEKSETLDTAIKEAAQATSNETSDTDGKDGKDGEASAGVADAADAR